MRPWRHQSGAVERSTLARAAADLREAEPGALRVVALHHHLLGAPWRSRKRPVSRRSEVLAELVAAGVDLVVAGHIHQVVIAERRDFEVGAGVGPAFVVAVAPGFGRPRPHRSGEAHGLMLYEATATELVVRPALWADGEFVVRSERRFERA